MRLVFRALESHTASVSVLIYLERKGPEKAYKNEIEYEMHIQAPTAVRTLRFLCDIGLVEESPGSGERIRNVRRLYALTEKGHRIARVLERAESELEREKDAGVLPIENGV